MLESNKGATVPIEGLHVVEEVPLVSLRGVTKSFGAVKALQSVDFDVYAGEVVAVVGDNGAGKTTLVKILAGDHKASSGEVLYKGEPVVINSPADSRELGIATVFQDLALCDNLDVVANLFLGREVGDMALDEVEMEQRSWALLRQLSAKLPTVRTPIASLSGGQRQTVAIARSLVGEPTVVILDEPTAALGVAQTAEVLNLIERLRENGLGVVLISHNMADVQAVADRVVVLRLGRNNGEFRVPDAVSYIAAVVAAGLYFWVTYRAQSRRAAAGLGSMHITETAVRALSLLALLGFGSWYLNKDRGIGLMFVLFVVLVVCTNYMLTRTKWGRSVYAVGGSVEAARRAGIRVNRVYVSVFIAGTTFAALGGLLAAARLAAANQSSGGGDANLTAIAAAVIGGTSLFGGRGSAWSALLGIVVIMSISSGLTLLSLDSSVRYMVTGGVLLLAVIVDAISRRSRASHGIA